MSLRKTACQSCVAAKRRCDREIPACSRCCKRSLTCQYPYPTSELEPCEQTNPPFDGSFGLDLSVEPDGFDFDFDLDLDLGLDIDLDLDLDLDLVFRQLPEPGSQLAPLEKRVLEFWPRVDDHEAWDFCTRRFHSDIEIFVHSGTTPLIHPSIYPRAENGAAILPRFLREAYGVCAAYQLRPYTQHPFYRQLLDQALNSLLAIQRGALPPHNPIPELLDRTQALILYYTMTFLAGGPPPPPHDTHLATQLETALARSTAELENTELAARTCPAFLPVHVGNSHSRHVCESARRLVVLSYLVRAVRSVLEDRRCDLI
ncbi:hypothetical protein ARAM_007528, partial [Aspergillus rambellii]